jgi:hypothetical protein
MESFKHRMGMNVSKFLIEERPSSDPGTEVIV